MEPTTRKWMETLVKDYDGYIEVHVNLLDSNMLPQETMVWTGKQTLCNDKQTFKDVVLSAAKLCVKRMKGL